MTRRQVAQSEGKVVQDSVVLRCQRAGRGWRAGEEKAKRMEPPAQQKPTETQHWCFRGGSKQAGYQPALPGEDRQGNLLAHTSKTPRRARRVLSHCRVLKGGMKGTNTATPCCWNPSALSRSCHHDDPGCAHPAWHGTLHQPAPQRSLSY